ncbi:hypothetical protein PARMER_01904 [Parabacteroides merdae ATCC 43184]|nr:hypothetical protein PARMER_01904 [Parabacteroides merdae ATCC 43184]
MLPVLWRISFSCLCVLIWTNGSLGKSTIRRREAISPVLVFRFLLCIFARQNQRKILTG